MAHIVCLCLVVMVLGLGVVVSSSSPYFSALGLVMVAGAGCVVLAYLGMAFYSLILFLAYLGGMLVVFGYSMALVVDFFPVSLGSLYGLISLILFISLTFTITFVLWGLPSEATDLMNSGSVMNILKNDTGGVSHLYTGGGILLVFAALVLFLTLLVVVGVAWGMSIGGLRLV